MLTGRFVAASEAERIGLVAEVVPVADLVARPMRWRPRSREQPHGVRMTKKVMWAQLETGSLLAGIALEDSTQVTAALSADHAEAVAALHRTPRRPTFGNR